MAQPPIEKIGPYAYGHSVLSVCADQIDEHPLTPPSSMEVDGPATSTVGHVVVGGGGGVLLSRHLTFLAGVLSLDSVAAAGQRSGPTSHIVASTVQLVLDAVLRRLERYHDDDDDDVMSHSAAVHAVDVVARVCDVTDAEVCDSVQQFARDVVTGIMSSQPMNQVIIGRNCYLLAKFDCPSRYFCCRMYHLATKRTGKKSQRKRERVFLETQFHTKTTMRALVYSPLLT